MMPLSMPSRALKSRALIKSLRTYHGDRSQRMAMDALYRQFIKPSDLAFDVGAHVGDRTSSFRRLGARVVSVEPQAALGRALRLIHGRDPMTALEQVAVGREQGRMRMMVNADNPTVSTLSKAFIDAAKGAENWRDQRWGEVVDVDVVTLDNLIGRHGNPTFIKLDVEGFEAEALAGLSSPVRTLSFEFTTIQRTVAFACIDRCVALGYRRFNAALGENQTLVGHWVDAGAIMRWLGELPDSANSGDVYCAL